MGEINALLQEIEKMDMKQVLENLLSDIDDGGVEDDTFAAACYITMASQAHRVLQDNADDAEASGYLSLCADSGCAGLAYVAQN